MTIKGIILAAAAAAAVSGSGSAARAQNQDYKVWVRNEGQTMAGIVVLGAGGTYIRTGVCLVPKEKRQLTFNRGTYSIKIRIEMKKGTSDCARNQTFSKVTSDFFNLRQDGRTMFTVWSTGPRATPTFGIGVN